MGRLLRLLRRCRNSIAGSALEPSPKPPPSPTTNTNTNTNTNTINTNNTTATTTSSTSSTSSPPSPQILSLPNELLLVIIDNFDHPSHLSSLARTSRGLLLRLTPFLHKIALQDKHGASAIHWAATFGYEPVVRLALRSGVPVDDKDWMGRTPLHKAMESCHEATVKLLLANGANVAARDLVGCTPLHLAIRAHLAVMRALKSGTIHTPNYADKRAQATLLQQTATRILLEHGADPNAQADDGDTALHYAARFFRPVYTTELIKLLLKKGANPLLRNYRGTRPSDSVMSWPHAYRKIKRSEWRRDKGYIYASILCIAGYPYAEYDKKYTLVKLLYGKDCEP